MNLFVFDDGTYWGFYGQIVSNGDFRPTGFVQGKGAWQAGSFASTDARNFSVPLGISGTVSASFSTDTKTFNGTLTEGAKVSTIAGGPLFPASTYNWDGGTFLPSASGVWDVKLLGGETASMTVSSDGAAFTGASTNGCSFTGTLSTRPPPGNALNASISFGPAPCVLAGQTLTGVGTLSYLVSLKDQLLLGFTDKQRTSGMLIYGHRCRQANVCTDTPP